MNIEIKPCDILFVWGDSIIEDIIEGVTKGPSHIAMFINETTLCEAQAGRVVGEAALSSYLTEDKYLEIWRDLTVTDDERKKMIEFAKSKYGYKYNYTLIPLELLRFEVGLNLDWYREHDKFICSTYIDEIGKSAGKHWSKVANPAPVDDEQQLTKLYVWRGSEWEAMNLRMESA